MCPVVTTRAAPSGTGTQHDFPPSCRTQRRDQVEATTDTFVGSVACQTGTAFAAWTNGLPIRSLPTKSRGAIPVIANRDRQP